MSSTENNSDKQAAIEFEARIVRGKKIEPGDWMPEAYRKQLICYPSKTVSTSRHDLRHLQRRNSGTIQARRIAKS